MNEMLAGKELTIVRKFRKARPFDKEELLFNYKSISTLAELRYNLCHLVGVIKSSIVRVGADSTGDDPGSFHRSLLG